MAWHDLAESPTQNQTKHERDKKEEWNGMGRVVSVCGVLNRRESPASVAVGGGDGKVGHVGEAHKVKDFRMVAGTVPWPMLHVRIQDHRPAHTGAQTLEGGIYE